MIYIQHFDNYKTMGTLSYHTYVELSSPILSSQFCSSYSLVYPKTCAVPHQKGFLRCPTQQIPHT